VQKKFCKNNLHATLVSREVELFIIKNFFHNFNRMAAKKKAKKAAPKKKAAAKKKKK
jgi:hypothetical protein